MQYTDNARIVKNLGLFELLTNLKTALLKFILCFFIITTSLLNAETVIGRCVGVADGDTATVLVNGHQQVKVRFHGIDAPESAQDFGQRAKQKLSDLIYGKQVRVEILERDRYGRSVAKVYVGSTYINLEMVKCGLAWHYVQYAPHDSDLADDESAARSAKIGLWSRPNPTPPWNWRRGVRADDKTSNTGDAYSGGSASGAYWVSGGGKVHNRSCRYFGSSNAGTYTDNPSGQNCRVCGGAGRNASSGGSVRNASSGDSTSGAYWVSAGGKVHNRSCRYFGSSNSGTYTDNPTGTNCRACGGTRR